jgi:hypothetical protein
MALAFIRHAQLSEPIDKFVLMFGRICVEDFLEVILCCGNGNGHAAEKLVRGLYERAVRSAICASIPPKSKTS